MFRSFFKQKITPVKMAIILMCCYLLLAVVLWIASNYHWFYSSTESEQFTKLHTYAITHKNTLETQVFETLYKQSEDCKNSTSTEKSQNCFKQISTYLSQTIIEEELTNTPQEGVNDLFFLKSEKEVIKILGWSGNVFETPTTFEAQLYEQNLWHFFSYLFGDCKIVNVLPDHSACEVVVPVYSNEQSSGYLLRLIPQNEEQSLLFWLFFLPLAPLFFLGILR